jgi:hypothetical protein
VEVHLLQRDREEAVIDTLGNEDGYFRCQECGLSDEIVAVVRAWRTAKPTFVVHPDLREALDELDVAAASELGFMP